jgi:hypothetical protein
MLSSCWDGDRKKRKSAVECLAILQGIYTHLTATSFDVLLSRNAYPREAMDQIYHHLNRMGFTVVYEEDIAKKQTNNNNNNKDNYQVRISKANESDELVVEFNDKNKKKNNTSASSSSSSLLLADINLDMSSLAQAVEEFENIQDGDDNDISVLTDEPLFVAKVQTSLQPLIDRLRNSSR